MQMTLNMENLKRDIMRFIGTCTGQGHARHPVSLAMSRNSSVERSDGSPGCSAGGGSAGEKEGKGAVMGPDELQAFKREIVTSLKGELQELAREMALATGHNARSSPINPPPMSSLAPNLTSELYQTHLYTQL